MRPSRRPPALLRRIKPKRGGSGDTSQLVPTNESYDESLRAPLDASLAKNLSILETALLDSDDIVLRKVKVGPKEELDAAIIFAQGLTSTSDLDSGVVKPILIELRQTDLVGQPVRRWGALIRDSGLTTPGVREISTLAEVVEAVLAGGAAVLVDRQDKGLAAEAPEHPKRGVEESPAERVVRGPHDAFIESLADNTAMIRRRLKDPHLKVRRSPIGRRSRTDVAMVYIQGLANAQLVDEVRSRLDSIDIDGFTDSGMIAHLIADDWATPFPLIESTDRSDRVALALLAGRVAVLAEGSPYALIAPTTFDSMMHSPEDYYYRWPIASALRFFRVISTFLALILPPLYIALTSFHPEMLPTQLLISIGSYRLRTPFPAIIEALSLELILEILREAGLRLPAPLGPTVGVVGGIVIGDAAVRAGLVSPGMVIVVGLTAIASFTLPNYELATAVRLLRFPLMVWTGVLGLFGLVTGSIAVVIHLILLKSFGTYYLAPLAPQQLTGLKDSLIRYPLASLKQRPEAYGAQDQQRLFDRRDEVVGPGGGE